jgi:hypothetical protein
MADLHISTELDNLTFVPGDRLRGHVEWTGLPSSDRPQKDKVELRLFHYTSGKGTRDIDIIDTRNFDNPASSPRRDFEFKLPDGPPSFSGKLISLIWALELVIKIDGEEFTEHLDIQLTPTGTEIDLYAHADQNAEAHLDGKKPWFYVGNKDE